MKDSNDGENKETSNLKHLNWEKNHKMSIIGIGRNPSLFYFPDHETMRQLIPSESTFHRFSEVKRYNTENKAARPIMCYPISSEFLLFGGKICEGIKHRQFAFNRRIIPDYAFHPPNKISIAKKHLVNDLSDETNDTAGYKCSYYSIFSADL